MIEILQLEEAATLAAIDELSSLFSQCVDGGASMGFMAPFPPEQAAVYWFEVAKSVGRNDLILLVARLNGRIEGTVQLGIATPPNQPHRADIKKLMVSPAARGHGLSRALMDAAETTALKAGRSLLVLDTATGEPAEKIYEHLGWVRSGTIPNYALFPDGRFCDTTIFYKQLA
ncbi:GNAT family N-acetyltransferase [Rhizobium sp. L1K21]|nr:GNAT family N-acetyltransferase [Rhizobium sp. L1K21]MCO6187415.1 GNAT family N-acetyltransferase [Rhizobium sp. L1K21]